MPSGTIVLLQKAEIDAILHWVDAGSPEGNIGAFRVYVRFPIVHGIWVSPIWCFKYPVVTCRKMESARIPFVIIPLHFEHDTWVRAAEFRIDSAGWFITSTLSSAPRNSSYLADFPRNQIFVPTVADRGKKRPEKPFSRGDSCCSATSRLSADALAENGAKLILAGSDFVFEMHFNPNGHEAIDQLGAGPGISRKLRPA